MFSSGPSSQRLDTRERLDTQFRAEVELAAGSDARVLVLGETGSGKEATARLIHALGPRRHAPFVGMSCSGMPATPFQSKLCGHRPDRVTGAAADADPSGVMSVAAGGTLFLDHVAELSLHMQATLLRFIQTRNPPQIAANKSLDVRVIAATNRDLYAQTIKREFNEDLYYRLNVILIRVPPLRARTADVLPLLRDFLAAASQAHGAPCPELTPGAQALLSAYSWPGNVRQPKNIAAALVVRQEGQSVTIRDLPPEILRAKDDKSLDAP